MIASEARAYERTRVPLFAPFVAALVDDAPRGRDIVDLGTGTGSAALLVARQLPPRARVVGIDIDRGMLRLARQNARDTGSRRCHFVAGDALRLPIVPASIDVVICSFAFVGEPAAFLHRVRQVLKDGGYLVGQRWAATGPEPERVYDEILGRWRMPAGNQPLDRVRSATERARAAWQSWGTVEGAAGELRAAGFADVRTRLHTATLRLPDAERYISWRAWYPPTRLELNAMTPDRRRGFEMEATLALRRLEGIKGLDIVFDAIQMRARNT